MKWLWWLGLTAAAAEDLKYREVSFKLLGILAVFGCLNLMGAAVSGGAGIAGHLQAFAVGLGLLLLSRITGGAIGEGDGLFFLLTACYFVLEEVLLLFLASLGVSCLWSACLLLRSRYAGGSLKETVPFLACAWLPGLWLIFR